jgi:hypothetical protein
MSDEEINRAIAEHVGWRWFDHPDTRERTKTFTLSDKWVLNPAGELVFPHSVPNFCRDLNAMHEAEKALLADADTGYQYDMELNGVCECWEDGVMNYMKLWHSTARQRAEAFLRAVGKWRENE